MECRFLVPGMSLIPGRHPDNPHTKYPFAPVHISMFGLTKMILKHTHRQRGLGVKDSLKVTR